MNRLALPNEAASAASAPASPPDGRRFVFVGGAPRSGTTLLQHILDCHPEVFGGPEFERVPDIVEAWRAVVDSFSRGRITEFCQRTEIDAAFAALIERLLLPAADARQARLLSEKTPFNVLVFSELLELFPRCRALHLVRDPRGVVCSMLHVGKRARAKNEPVPHWTLNLQEAVEVVAHALASGFRAEERYPDRLLTLTYESLALQPEDTIRRVCTFLDLTFDPAMLAPHAQKHPAQDKLVQLDNGTWVDPKLGFRAIETSRLHAWQTDLDPPQIAYINDTFRAHPALHRLGYSFA